MHKVITIPRIPGVKTAIFTKRIIGFHMTCAPLDGGKEGNHTDWYDMKPSLVDMMKMLPAAIRISNIFWVDNCSAQNKCWTLYTALFQVVNHPD